MINTKLIKFTGEKRSYHLKGSKETFDIYEIPLDQLKYNVQNGRIASYISQYIEEKGELPKEYNKIIESFIVESNEKAFKDTKNNIKSIGQMEPAIVLSTGVVIDGNRRFTALRQLMREGAGKEFGYIKAAILQEDELTLKEIKTLELNLQHAREERVDYNPIEFLVDVYRDLVGNAAEFTPEEYARETQSTLKKVNFAMRKSKLMVEFLDFINKPHKYYVARDLKLDGPLGEIDNIMQSRKIDDDLRDEIKEYLFFNLAIIREGDITRIIRSLKPIAEENNKFTEAFEETEDLMDELYDYFNEDEYKKDTNTFSIPDKLRSSAWEKTSDRIEAEKHEKAQQKPVNTARRALKQIESIDIGAVIRMDKTDKAGLASYLEQIINISKSLREEIDA